MNRDKTEENKIHVTWTGWIALVILLVMVSGIFSKSSGPLAALDAATLLFQPILKVIMGIPGTAGLAFVGSFTSVDVGSVMTKDLFDEGKITDDERTIFVAYQNAGSAIITNLLTTGAPLMAIIPFSFALILGVCMFCKLLGANLIRLILLFRKNKEG